MNILEAMADRNLFGSHFESESWAAWRAFQAALFALPMDDADLDIYHRHTGRQELPAEPFREADLICGRRGGKSRILALIAVYLACFRDYEPYLAAGEVGTLPIISADRKQGRQIFRYIEGFLNGSPMLKSMMDGEPTQESIALKNRIVIEIHTASFRVTRGYTLIAALCDEVAFWRSDDSANPDTEILAALRPGLSSIPGSMLLIASSPYAKRGALYAAFRKHWAQDGSRVLVWRGSTKEMNPAIDPVFLAAQYEDDPARASAEYGAEFRNDIEAFVSREVIDACTATGHHEFQPISGIRYSAFVDPSGGSADSMTLAIAHHAGDRAILDAVREVRPPFSPESVVSEFAELLWSFGIRTVTGDRYAGEWPRERFSTHGITYEVSERPKSDLYRDVLPMLNSGAVQLLDLARLAAQFCGLERRTARGGRDSIDHGPGAHDDLANAAAGALLMAGKPKMEMGFGVLESLRPATNYFL